jgi:hypothetical protein
MQYTVPHVVFGITVLLVGILSFIVGFDMGHRPASVSDSSAGNSQRETEEALRKAVDKLEKTLRKQLEQDKPDRAELVAAREKVRALSARLTELLQPPTGPREKAAWYLLPLPSGEQRIYPGMR